MWNFSDEGELLYKLRIKTTSPKENIEESIEFFKQYDIKALGIGTFGPADVDKSSDKYGYFLDSQKILWQNFDLPGALSVLDVPMGLTSDGGYQI
mgnify:CR=1 FL=1